MAVTRTRKSGLTNSAKRNDTGAGNMNYPWAEGAASSTIYGGLSTSGYTPDSISMIETLEGKIQGIAATSGPGNPTQTFNGTTWGTNGITALNYGTFARGFNGLIFGAGNYMSSSAAFTDDLRKGWTYITGHSGLSANYGYGNGGFNSTGRSVYVIPYTQGGVHKIVYTSVNAGTQAGVIAGGWFNQDIATATGNGYQSRCAVTGDRIVVAYNINASTATAADQRLAFAPISATTGLISSGFFAGTISGLTGYVTSVSAVNGTFVLATSTNQVYTSTDGGANWAIATSPFAGTNNIFVSQETAGKILLVERSNGTGSIQCYSSSNGTNWTSMFFGAGMNPGGSAAVTNFGAGAPGYGIQCTGTVASYYYNQNIADGI